MLGIEEILCELGGGCGGAGGRESEQQGGLPPGFRFHPTDEELITFYLASKVFNSSFCGVDIAEVDLNRCEPWELPEVAKMGEREWYFYSLRDRKYPTGLRTNRATGAGYWKATGKDREVYSSGSGRTLLGMKKTLVFYKGRAPHGEKTKWVMHEYRLDGDFSYRHTCKDEWVICRIFHKLGEKKANGGQNCLHFKHQRSTPEPSPSTPTVTEITKNPFHEGTTPLILHHTNPPSLQNPFLFGDNHQEIHGQDLKSLLNLPSFPNLQNTPHPTLVKPLTLPNQPTTPLAKQCKTEAHFSIAQLTDANVHRWGMDFIPPPPLFPFEQPDLGPEMDYYFTGGGSGSGSVSSGDTRFVVEGTSDRNSEMVSFDRVGFNQLLLPSI
ncbi:unnamed protein product [Lactuca virosa]|uniref:NAC domain-containing protein n=1 Tax=Lactuca virosa TaxID=75947 RepID=A0AAU9P953_9ASTR|nr:unnamed protein product [Lactuca virosa]